MNYYEAKEKKELVDFKSVKKLADLQKGVQYYIGSEKNNFIVEGPETKKPKIITGSFLKQEDVKSTNGKALQDFFGRKVPVLLPYGSVGTAKTSSSGKYYGVELFGKEFLVYPNRISESGDKVAFGKPSGEQWESLIIYNYYLLKNKKALSNSELSKVVTIGRMYSKTQYAKVAKKIVESVFNKEGQSLIKLASDQPVTKEWENYFKKVGESNPNKTPKTDILLNNSEGYSLKISETGSQLMSGFRSESLATLQCALDKAVVSKKLKSSELIKAIEKALLDPEVGYSPFKTVGAMATKLAKIKKELTDELKNYAEEKVALSAKKMTSVQAKNWLSIINKYKTKINELIVENKLTLDEYKAMRRVLQQKTFHKEGTSALNELLQNKEVKLQFIYEAATGTTKFGKNSTARATKILEFNSEDGSAAVHPVDKPSDMEEYLPTVQFTIGFKTSGSPKSSLRALLQAATVEDPEFETEEEGKKLEKAFQVERSSYNFINSAVQKVYYEELQYTGKRNQSDALQRELLQTVNSAFSEVYTEGLLQDALEFGKAFLRDPLSVIKSVLNKVDELIVSLVKKSVDFFKGVWERYVKNFLKLASDHVTSLFEKGEALLVSLAEFFELEIDKTETKFKLPRFLAEA